MGIKSIIKMTFGQIVNLRFNDWLNTANHKNNINYIKNTFNNIFIKDINQNNQETFEEAMQRLNLTEQDILNRKKEFIRLVLISLGISLLLFSYTMFITIKYKSFYGFVLGISISTLSLAQAFKYHFWLTQINKRKLGLTFKEWLN